MNEGLQNLSAVDGRKVLLVFSDRQANWGNDRKLPVQYTLGFDAALKTTASLMRPVWLGTLQRQQREVVAPLSGGDPVSTCEIPPERCDSDAS